MKKNYFGFTLVELLVVISIIGILSSIGLVAFTSAQARSRDAKRKSDLKELSSALELFYSDYGKYPGSSGGQILACPSTTPPSACVWGEDELTDGKTIYFKVLPKDQSTGHTYYYRTVENDSKYQIYAYLENSQDSSIISTSLSCGTGLNCNFAITSSNTTPFE